MSIVLWFVNKTTANNSSKRRIKTRFDRVCNLFQVALKRFEFPKLTMIQERKLTC